MRKWLPLMILASAQFIMVLDSSVMNVSISQIVADLNTTVTGVQSAITMYTLVMAAFMLVGAKLGDILGRDHAFALGLAVYGLGSLITSLSPNLTVLLIGWSGIEGLGAVLVIPAIAALTAANYEGKDRAFAYGMIGGAAGAAIAAGPLIGGYVTTTWSWRYVFVGEVVVVIAVLLVHRRMKRAPKPAQPPKLDYGGAALSGDLARADRVRDPEEQHLGLDQADRRAHDRRARDHATRIFARAVPDRRRLRRPRLLPGLGGAPRTARQDDAPRPHAPEDRGAARRTVVALRAAVDRDGNVLRAAGVPPGRARLRRVRDGQAALPDVRLDAGRCAPGAEGRSAARAAGRRPDRTRGNGNRRARARRDDRRDPPRDGLRRVAHLLRNRRGAPHVAARQRDHVLRPCRTRRTRQVDCREQRRTSARPSAPR